MRIPLRAVPLLVLLPSIASSGVEEVSPQPDWHAEGNQPGSRFGFSVAAAGDVNGDGFDDVIIGAPDFDNVGKVFVYFGSPTGLAAAPGWTKLGDQVGAQFGYSVSGVGDMKGDGFADVAVGQPRWDESPAGSQRMDWGRIQVFHGGPDPAEGGGDRARG